MPEFVFRRAFPWVQKALTPVVPIRGPDAFLSTLLPTVDIFGTQRLDEETFQQVLGGPGNLEVAHGAVPADRVRLYTAAELSHDDAANTRWIRIGRIIAVSGAAFNFVGLTDAQLRPAATSPDAGQGAIAARAIWIGPGGRIAGRVDSLVPGAQLALRLSWVELVLGETVAFDR